MSSFVAKQHFYYPYLWTLLHPPSVLDLRLAGTEPRHTWLGAAAFKAGNTKMHSVANPTYPFGLRPLLDSSLLDEMQFAIHPLVQA